MGTRTKQTGAAQAGAHPTNHRRGFGGQAGDPGLFGLPSITGRPRRSSEARTATQAKANDIARQIGGLTFRHPSVRLQAHVAVGVANFTRQAAATPATARPVLSFEQLRAKYRPATLQPQPVAPEATPAMLEAAAASDLREAFPFFHDEEPWERVTLFGQAELALAQD